MPDSLGHCAMVFETFQSPYSIRCKGDGYKRDRLKILQKVFHFSVFIFWRSFLATFRIVRVTLIRRVRSQNTWKCLPNWTVSKHYFQACTYMRCSRGRMVIFCNMKEVFTLLSTRVTKMSAETYTLYTQHNSVHPFVTFLFHFVICMQRCYHNTQYPLLPLPSPPKCRTIPVRKHYMCSRVCYCLCICLSIYLNILLNSIG